MFRKLKERLFRNQMAELEMSWTSGGRLTAKVNGEVVALVFVGEYAEDVSLFMGQVLEAMIGSMAGMTIDNITLNEEARGE